MGGRCFFLLFLIFHVVGFCPGPPSFSLLEAVFPHLSFLVSISVSLALFPSTPPPSMAPHLPVCPSVCPAVCGVSLKGLLPLSRLPRSPGGLCVTGPLSPGFCPCLCLSPPAPP